MKYKIIPMTLREAREFCDIHHRHNTGSHAHKFSIGLTEDGHLVGVAIVGRPVARHEDDGRTAEILRVCVLTDYRNANSKLYGACIRACRAMGYTRVITYTLRSESGASLKAAGFYPIPIPVDGHKSGWDTPSRRRIPQAISVEPKYRWCRDFDNPWEAQMMTKDDCD